MKRLLRITALILAVLLLVGVLAWWWLTSTRGGAQWLIGQVQSRVAALSYAELTGNLGDGLVLDEVAFEQAGLVVAAESLELAVSVDVWTPRIDVRRLHASALEVTLPAAPEEPEPAAGPIKLGDYGAPVAVTVDSLRIDGFVLRTSPDAAPLKLARIEFAGDYGDALDIERLAVRRADQALSLEGRLGLSDPWRSGLRAALDWTLTNERSQRAELRVRGALDRLDVTVTTDGPLSVEGNVEVRGLPDPDALAGRVALAGSLENWPGVDGSLRDVRLQASGNRSDWQAQLAAGLRWLELPPVDADLALTGTAEAIEIGRGRLSALSGTVDVTGRAELGDAPTATAAVRLSGLDFTPLYPEWPGQAAVSGGFDVDWDGSRLALDELQLRAPPAPLTVSGNAAFALPEHSLEVSLNWESFTWPPVTGDAKPLVASESGRLQGSGTLEEWQAELEAWLQAPDHPRARVELDVTGDAEHVDIDRGTVALQDAGTMRLSGRVGFAGPPSARLDLALEALNPGALVPELPGLVDGRAVFTFDGVEPLSIGLSIESLDGRLRGQPLAGSGSLAVLESRVECADIRLSLGDNRVELGTSGGETWQVAAIGERLGQLWPGLAGSFEAEAVFDPAARTAEWTLQSPGLSWQQRRVAALESDGELAWGEAPRIDVRVEAVDVDLNPWERLEGVTLRVAGNCRAHELDTFVTGSRATVDLSVTGHLPTCLDASPTWAGVVRRLTITNTPLGAWQLDQNLPVQFRDGAVRAELACLWTPDGPGRVCLNGLRAGADGEAALAFNALPLDLLLLPMDPIFRVGSRLRGAVRLGWDASGVRDLGGTLVAGPGAFRLLGSDQDLVEIAGVRLNLAAPQPRALRSDLALRLEAGTELTASATIPDLSDPADLRLDVDARLNLPDLAALNRLVPELDEMGGRLQGRFQLSGPLASPHFEGRLAVEDGSFYYAPLGARVRGLGAVLEADPDGAHLDGSFAMGDGTGRLKGRIDLDASGGPEARVALDADRLQLFDVDWLHLTTTSDLTVALLPERVELNGRVGVDRARLGMPPGAAQAVSASDDVVVVGREESADESSEARPPRDIVGQVELSLGDDVRLQAAGMQSRVTGQLGLDWEPGRYKPTAEGSLHLVEGSYRAYGQSLEVTQGDVLFTGRPVDNPVLQIEAVRDIFGDPQVEQAGVRIQGAARDPEIDLFTDPPTNREKALAYILTGAEFDHAAGQGAFNVGFFVLPKLFVSYGVGLFETGDVLAARYELSRRWGIRATSGERDTGVDVSFIIDR